MAGLDGPMGHLCLSVNVAQCFFLSVSRLSHLPRSIVKMRHTHNPYARSRAVSLSFFNSSIIPGGSKGFCFCDFLEVPVLVSVVVAVDAVPSSVDADTDDSLTMYRKGMVTLSPLRNLISGWSTKGISSNGSINTRIKPPKDTLDHKPEYCSLVRSTRV